MLAEKLREEIDPVAGMLAPDMDTPQDYRTIRERDLYQKLLELRGEAEPRTLVGQILELLVTTTHARRGYLELYPSREDLHPRWMISHGCSPEQENEIRAATSRGIVAAALATGTTLHVPSALLDDRFASLPSVRSQRLEAVVCVPLGNVGGGVLYLEGNRGTGPFDDADLRLAENVAKYLWPALDQLARAAQLRAHDPTRPFRQRLQLDDIVGRSAALAGVFEQIEPYAPLDVTLLVTGPNGTGKTQLAHAIHANSHRRNGPFVELNCGAIPEGLIESELFGTMPGAFPGARRMSGKVEAAEGGTLFLDEIVEIPINSQGKLLQLLQSRQYHALGSNKLATANIRLIAATNVDLPAMVAAKRFREDLFYRINIVNIRMPALSERRDDIGVLVDEMMIRIAREHNLAPLAASEQLRYALEALDWPGNIRELRSKVEAALIKASAENAPQVEVRHIPGLVPPEHPTTFHEATRAYQRELLRRELLAQSWNVSAVAKRLDLTRAHVYNLIQQFKLRRDE
ncbi:MAG TPA: sigma-54-dependent Fis family transcriptional regulator [Kofleriaceae bacterium]|jgi:Nif-specific regulatory protein|nr:sigma-54-dependent Fis family transcriptional regulator [Kofleriaceae bacterium]